MKGSKLDIYIKQYLEGDSNAFDIIYEETKKIVYLSIYPYVKNQMAIEDLMQDTYMKAINNLKSYKLGTNFHGWICMIARNTAINYYNKFKKQELLEEYDASEQVNNDSLVALAMDVLEGLEKDVIIYHIVLNMKFKEIAKILDKPLSTVYVIYKNAIKNIKNKL